MKTILDVLNLATSYLEAKKIANPRRQAQDLISLILGLKRVELYLEHDRPLTEVELEHLRTALSRRAKGEPVAYILGHTEFYNCRIHVNPHVLIPRQETELLVDKIAKQLTADHGSIKDAKGCAIGGRKTLLDLCCGSGCIGIALKKKIPALNVVLSDVSTEALSVARKNAEVNGVDVEFLQGDLLQPFKGRQADYIVSNPPYVRACEYEALENEVKYEPRLALVGGDTGLDFYSALAKSLPEVLLSGAKVWFEIGADQGNSVLDLFKSPFWKRKTVDSDLSGKDRFFFLEIE